jgi:hypothetical protein
MRNIIIIFGQNIRMESAEDETCEPPNAPFPFQENTLKPSRVAEKVRCSELLFLFPNSVKLGSSVTTVGELRNRIMTMFVDIDNERAKRVLTLCTRSPLEGPGMAKGLHLRSAYRPPARTRTSLSH